MFTRNKIFIFCTIQIVSSLVKLDLRDKTTGRQLTDSNILDLLLDTIKYNGMLRPNSKTLAPVQVYSKIFLHSLSDIDLKKQSFIAQVNVAFRWFDERLAFEILNPDKIPGALQIYSEGIPIDDITFKRLWLPPVFFPNERNSIVHQITTPNKRAWLYNNGKIIYEFRLTVSLTCPMYLHYFPMDTHLLVFQIQSYGLTNKDIQFHWEEQNAITYSHDAYQKLPEFIIDSDESVAKRAFLQTYLTSGTYSSLEVKFKVKRQVGFYLVQIYFTSLLLINLSWFTFWIDPLNAPARVGVGIFVVLNLLTMWISENSALPQVSYIKALDVWLFMSIVCSFLSLIEYACVNVCLRRPDLSQKAVDYILKHTPHTTACSLLAPELTQEVKAADAALAQEVLNNSNSNSNPAQYKGNLKHNFALEEAGQGLNYDYGSYEDYIKKTVDTRKSSIYFFSTNRRDSDSSSSSSSDDEQMNNSLEEYFQAQVQNHSRQNNNNNQARLRPVARHRNKNWNINNFNHNLQTTSTTQSGNVFTDNTATYQSLPKSYSTYRSKTNRNCGTLPNASKKMKISATNSSAKNTNSPNENQTEPAKPVEPPKTPEPTKPKVNFIANRIDVVARVFFPMSFLVFNFAYWYYYSRMALTDF